MREIDFRVRLFLDDGDLERSERAMHFLLHALCCVNIDILHRFGKQIPALYESGVRYDNARAGKKEWFDILTCLERGRGDCKDLACYRIAELRMAGVRRATPFIRYRMRRMALPGGGWRDIRLYHVLVRLPNGTLEDPSRRLGMGRDDWAPFDTDAAGTSRLQLVGAGGARWTRGQAEARLLGQPGFSGMGEVAHRRGTIFEIRWIGAPPAGLPDYVDGVPVRVVPVRERAVPHGGRRAAG